MDSRINDVDLELTVIDADALLTPKVMAHILAEVRRQLEDDARLNNQRNADRSADVRGGRR